MRRKWIVPQRHPSESHGDYMDRLDEFSAECATETVRFNDTAARNFKLATVIVGMAGVLMALALIVSW